MIKEKRVKKTFSFETKLEAIRLVETKQMDVINVAKKFETKTKNIKNWLTKGKHQIKSEGKKGKKIQDVNMENKLIDFFFNFFKKNNIEPSETILRNYAKNISNDKEFKASRGWYEKFIKRFHLIHSDKLKDIQIEYWINTCK